MANSIDKLYYEKLEKLCFQAKQSKYIENLASKKSVFFNSNYIIIKI